MKKSRKARSNHTIFFLVLLIATILVYGLKIGKMGLYWDDIPNTFFEANNGAINVMRSAATWRRAIAPLYFVSYWVIGENPIAWQIFGLLTRWLLVSTMYLFLTKLEPKNMLHNQKIALLMLIFPGFQQQWISKIYSHIYLVFIFEFISLAIFLRGIRKKQTWMLVLSLLISFYCLYASEYVFGLEFMRPVILYYEITKSDPKLPKTQIFKRTFLKWLPYFLSLIVFIVLRTFFSNTLIYSVKQVDEFTRSPIAAISDLSAFTFHALYTSIFTSWQQIFSRFSYSTNGKSDLIYLLAIIGFCALFLFMQKRFYSHQKDNQKNTPSNQKLLLWLSISSLLFAGVPFWAAGLTPTLGFPDNRFYLSYMFGSSILIFFGTTLFRKWRKLANIVFALFFCFGCIFHFNLADHFIKSWNEFQVLMQQLSWRAPALEENTFLVAKEFPIQYYSDNSLTGAVNWLYAVDTVNNNLPYHLDYTDIRLGKSLKSLAQNEHIHHKYLLYEFNGSTDQMLVLFQKPSHCLHVALPEIDHLHPDVPEILNETVSLSNLNQIHLEENQRNLFFLNDSDESWCYYYQKASLAYQFENWTEITTLGSKAFSTGLQPNDPSELIPFIFGYYYTDNWERAVDLTLSRSYIGNEYQEMLCEVWNIIDRDSPESEHKTWALSTVKTELVCR